jgi:hypothetical protein
LVGCCAILPGKDVAVGDTWTWKGDLLNVAGGDALVATFRLAEVISRDGETLARIEGKVDEGWRDLKGAAPKVAFELLFSIDRGVPVESTHRYESASRTTTIRTRAEWQPATAKPATGQPPKQR